MEAVLCGTALRRFDDRVISTSLWLMYIVGYVHRRACEAWDGVDSKPTRAMLGYVSDCVFVGACDLRGRGDGQW